MFPTSIEDAGRLLRTMFTHFENPNSSDQDRFVPILISKPGAGKSATLETLAEEMGYTLIDLNLACIEPTDIIGLGAREKINGEWVTLPALPSWTQKAFAGECFILIDEFNNTTRDVMAGFQKMFSQFSINGIPLPRTTHIVGACNAPGKDALMAEKRLSNAFRRRLCMIPVIDDFEYIEKKHNVSIPNGLKRQDYSDIIEYCSYDEMSSAVADNVLNISKYEGLDPLDKVRLINGFGEGALDFAKALRLFPESVFATRRIVNHESEPDITRGDWKKNPQDCVSEYQQVVWGQDILVNSRSYGRSKKFVSRVENHRVYEALLNILEEQFPTEMASDLTPLPPTRVL